MDTCITTIARAAATLAVAAGLSACAATGRQKVHDLPVRPPIEQLKLAYLECDRHASQHALDSATAALCSVISEELLRTAFGGDLDRLLAWWQRERRPNVSAG